MKLETKQNKAKIDSQIQKANEWFQRGGGGQNGGGQNGYWQLGGTNLQL